MYPPIEAYQTGTLKVSDIHTLYYEISGNKEGSPGGPGGGTDPSDRRFFNPEKYNIILYHQRGAGKSTPSACLEENTTWDLVKDTEKLREELKVEKWHVFGGSWGSTLSLAYAQSHPDRVKSLTLRGIFTLRKREEYVAPIPEAERQDMVLAYHAQLNAVDDETRLKAAKAWSKWEMATSKLYVDPVHVAEADKDDFANAFARIENHYFINSVSQLSVCELPELIDVYLTGLYEGRAALGNARNRQDATTAYALKKSWPELTLHIVPDAGHSSREPGTTKKLVEATDSFADL
ncbi:hypothetical protein HWV62_3456 [Athelia sp. TMB]|nr:hypothetical protein HWV62_3456 [Athelia sp. TMB]